MASPTVNTTPAEAPWRQRATTRIAGLVPTAKRDVDKKRIASPPKKGGLREDPRSASHPATAYASSVSVLPHLGFLGRTYGMQTPSRLHVALRTSRSRIELHKFSSEVVIADPLCMRLTFTFWDARSLHQGEREDWNDLEDRVKTLHPRFERRHLQLRRQIHPVMCISFKTGRLRGQKAGNLQ